jgi:hypothetical protein
MSDPDQAAARSPFPLESVDVDKDVEHRVWRMTVTTPATGCIEIPPELDPFLVEGVSGGDFPIIVWQRCATGSSPSLPRLRSSKWVHLGVRWFAESRSQASPQVDSTLPDSAARGA